MQQKAAVPFYQQDNWGTKMSCYHVIVTEDGGRNRSRIQVPCLPEPWKTGLHPSFSMCLAPINDTPLSLVCCHKYANSSASTANLGHSHTSKRAWVPHTPSHTVQAHICLPLCTTSCWELSYDKRMHKTATTSSTVTRWGKNHLWPLRPHNKSPVPLQGPCSKRETKLNRWPQPAVALTGY